MIKKRLSKKAQEASESYSYLVKILLIIAIAIALYYTLRSIGNAFLPK